MDVSQVCRYATADISTNPNKAKKNKNVQEFNHGQNICKLFLVLAQFSFATSETELDYYHQNVIVRVLTT